MGNNLVKKFIYKQEIGMTFQEEWFSDLSILYRWENTQTNRSEFRKYQE